MKQLVPYNIKSRFIILLDTKDLLLLMEAKVIMNAQSK